MAIEIRQALTDEDYEAWRQVRLAVLPNEQTQSVEWMRLQDLPVRLLLVASLDGELAGSGLGDRSDSGLGFVAPRVIPALRGRGVGTALLERLLAHVVEHGFEKASAHVDAADGAAVGFAQRRGFVEVDRQVEQVRAIRTREDALPDVDGVRFTTIAERPELLDATYDLASEGYADFVFAVGSVHVSREQCCTTERRCPTAHSSRSQARRSSATPG